MARAAHEQAFAKRTWFSTYTFRPAERAKVMKLASSMNREKTQGGRLVAASGVSIAKYFKRLRRAGFELRYLCVPEPHRDGFPHWHALVHDQRGDLNWETLSSQWRDGFSVVKLVRDAKALRYVTKYLHKANHGRVRASLNYGETEAERQQFLAESRQSEGLRERALDALEEGGAGPQVYFTQDSLLD